jgi:putative ABC transport system permease protein
MAVLGRRVGENTLRDAGRVFVATPELLVHLGIEPGAVDADTMLLTPQAGDVHLTGDITSTRFRADPVPAGAVQRIEVPGHRSAPRTLITETGLQAAGLTSMRAGWLIEARGPLDADQLARARELAADAGLTVESRDGQAGLATVRTAASAAGVLLALGILAMTVGLLRSEARHELRTLTAAGATSRTRRALTAGTAGVLALVGVVLGTAGAYAALLAGYWPDTGRLGNVPVVHLTAIAVGLPLLATVVSWTLAGREPAGLARRSTG